MVLAPNFIIDNGFGEQRIAEHHMFKSEEILPFTSWNVLSDKGASGEVFQATMEEDYHAFSKHVVAVKHLHSDNRDSDRNRAQFLNESGILKSLSQPGHMREHLISLLASFEQSGKYYLLFPWADRDLEDFWQHVPPEEGMSAWLIRQCKGLAEAMTTIHRYETKIGTHMPHQGSYSQSPASARGETNEHGAISLIGRHGDIKPSNILWFSQDRSDPYGILKITDFGIARFTPENLDSKREIGFVPNSITYRSPECDLPSKQIGAHCDVWALGCVFLVFATWFFGGYQEVVKFGNSRQSPDKALPGSQSDVFFTIENDTGQKLHAKVKPAVTLKIEALREHTGCTPRFVKLLNLIEHHMVIVQNELESLPIPGSPQPRRKSAGSIARDLGSIRLEA